MHIEIKKTTAPAVKPAFSDLQFGRFFSDHMFSVKYQMQKWDHLIIEPRKNLSLDPAASVLHYGQALFEGMKAFRQQNGSIVLFRPDFNWNRMRAGADRLCMEVPSLEVFMEGLKELVKIDQDWIPHEPGCSLYLRPTLIGTEAFLGVRPSQEILFFIIASPVKSYFSEGQAPVKIWIEENYLRAAPGGLGATKAAANYASSLKAASEAKKNGYAQVLWLDVEKKYVEEVGTMNVFFVFENEIVTPALDGTILGGGVRDSVLQLLKSWKLPVVERKVSLNEILSAGKNGKLLEVFGTGTAAVISPVGELCSSKEKLLINQGKMGPLAEKLFTEISDILYGNKPDTFSWLTPVV